MSVATKTGRCRSRFKGTPFRGYKQLLNVDSSNSKSFQAAHLLLFNVAAS